MTVFLSSLLVGLLSAYAFWLQITLGALAILLIGEITGGRWRILIRPTLLSIVPNLYLLTGVFVLIGLLSGELYPVKDHQMILSMPFFTARGLVYFAIWIFISRGYQKRIELGRPARTFSGGSLLALLFTVSFSSMDWFMTLIPNWTSTGYGVVFIAGCLGAAFAFSTLIAAHLNGKLSTAPSPDHKPPLLLDLGNLVMMSVLLWAYVSFMQYLIIWSGQLPSELYFYDLLAANHWITAVLISAAFCFAVPFFALLFRDLKKSPEKMKILMLIFLLGRFVDELVWTAPAKGLRFLPGLGLGLLALLLVGLPWTVIFVKNLANQSRDLTKELSA